jgi:hypothetical protein
MCCEGSLCGFSLPSPVAAVPHSMVYSQSCKFLQRHLYASVLATTSNSLAFPLCQNNHLPDNLMVARRRASFVPFSQQH